MSLYVKLTADQLKDKMINKVITLNVVLMLLTR